MQILLRCPFQKEESVKGDLVVELTMDNSLDGVPAINTENICSFAIDRSTYGVVVFS
jgi:hypothetical protein